MAKIWRVLIATVLALALLAAWALYQGLVVRRYTVRTEKLAKGASLRAVLLTDFHSDTFGDAQRDLIDKVAAQNPDIILLGGDIVDDVRPIEHAQALFEGLRSLGIPTYYVSGNHELWRDDYRRVRRMIAGYGITVLRGEGVSIPVDGGKVRLYGIGDPLEHRDYGKALRSAFSNIREDAFCILLAHRPEWIDAYAALSFDLALSGHAHGGQIRIPLLLNGLYAPDQGWFPKYAGGEYRVEDTTLIVSRGLAVNPRLPRVFNPPEVVVVDIRANV